MHVTSYSSYRQTIDDFFRISSLIYLIEIFHQLQDYQFRKKLLDNTPCNTGAENRLNSEDITLRRTFKRINFQKKLDGGVSSLNLMFIAFSWDYTTQTLIISKKNLDGGVSSLNLMFIVFSWDCTVQLRYPQHFLRLTKSPQASRCRWQHCLPLNAQRRWTLQYSLP